MLDAELAEWLADSRVAVEIDPWFGGVSVHVAGQASC